MRVVTRRALTVVKSRVLHASLKQCFFSFLLSSFGPNFLQHDLGFYQHILMQCNSEQFKLHFKWSGYFSVVITLAIYTIEVCYMYPSLWTRPTICPTITGVKKNIYNFLSLFHCSLKSVSFMSFQLHFITYYLMLLLSVPKWNNLDRHVRSYYKSILSQEVSS